MENETKQEDEDLVAEMAEPKATEGEAAPEMKRDTTMGMLCHLLGLVQLLGVPFGNILGPLVIWLIKKRKILLWMSVVKRRSTFRFR